MSFAFVLIHLLYILFHDLENILLTAPDSTMHSSKVRNIIWRDNNNVNRSVKYVYWCPDGVTAKLVWQRDHSPTQEDFTTIKYNNQPTDKAILVKFTANTNLIETVEFWTRDLESLNNPSFILYDTSINLISQKSLNVSDFSHVAEQLSVDGNITTVHHWTISNINVSVNSSTTYYIYAGVMYDSGWHPVPLVSKSYNTGDYKIVTSEDYTLVQTGQIQYETMTNTYLPKYKVNGVQI